MGPDFLEKLIWGGASVLVVSLMSVVGGLFLPCLKGSTRRKWFHFFIAMAVATLASDAILHLLPEAMGVHSHGDHDHHHDVATNPGPHSAPHDHEVRARRQVEAGHGHSHDHGEHGDEHEDAEHEHGSNGSRLEVEHGEHKLHSHVHEARGFFEYTKERDLLCKLSSTVLVVIGLYFLELIWDVHQKGKGHSHSGKPEKAEIFSISDGEGLERAATGFSPMRRMSQASPSMSQQSASVKETTDLIVSRRASHVVDTRAPVVCWGIRSTAMLILLGDAVHNFIDGIAIGAAFAASTQSGISTSIAVLCHELPHELGDMAILLESGLSMSKALFLNFLSALTAFIGLLFGVAAMELQALIPWMLTITAGMFLYVAWLDMLNHLRDGMGKAKDMETVLLQVLGFVCGFLIIFLIGWFEHELGAH
ncbi:unnamed protein product, partial [Mesorhabditis spiculigera]